MSALSSYLENKINDHILGNVPFTAPTTVFFALFTTAPNEAGTGGTEVNTSGTGYSRVGVTNNSTNFPASVNGAKTNAANITFGTATSNWGTISAFGVYDSVTGGNLLYFGPLSTSRSIVSGDTARFANGDFTITFE